MRFFILGPCEARLDDRPVALGGMKQRALLTLLLLEGGRVVSGDRLIEDLWGPEPDDRARHNLQEMVSQLRKALASAGDERERIVTRSPGYSIELAHDELDLHTFERLMAEGRAAYAAGDTESAVVRFEDALSLWRGPALPELASEGSAPDAIARLEELRLAAVEDRIAAGLTLGHHAELVAELRDLVDANPYREHLRAQLMLALYRSGRQAEALETYRHARTEMAEAFGIDPSRELVELHSAILAQDPMLAAPDRAPSPIPLASAAPAIEYARNGPVSIAFEVVGDGPIDLLYIPGFVSNLDLNWELPAYARVLRTLGSFTRLIIMDRRGTGLSDPIGSDAHLSHETMVDDMLAVLDAAASRRAALFGFQEGGLLCALFAAIHPERTRALVTYGTAATGLRADDYPWQWAREEWEPYLALLAERWGTPTHADEILKWIAPTAFSHERVRTWWRRYCRLAASPASAVALERIYSETDIRDLLPSIHVPTLILHNTLDLHEEIGSARYLTSRIPGATLVELTGTDSVPWGDDADTIVDQIERFLGGIGSAPDDDRSFLTALLVVDTGIDLAADRDTIASLCRRHRGRALVAEEGRVRALFDGPARAVRCGLAIVDMLGGRARAGIHVGDVEVEAERARGPGVEVCERVLAAAGPGDVVVSGVLKDLVAGSGIIFSPRDRSTPDDLDIWTAR